jgi:hypothetical protein
MEDGFSVITSFLRSAQLSSSFGTKAVDGFLAGSSALTSTFFSAGFSAAFLASYSASLICCSILARAVSKLVLTSSPGPILFSTWFSGLWTYQKSGSSLRL